MEVDEILLYHTLGQEYGWTPRDVNEAPKKVVQGLLILLQVYGAKSQSAQKEAEGKARMRQ